MGVSHRDNTETVELEWRTMTELLPDSKSIAFLHKEGKAAASEEDDHIRTQ